jgi:hypothetical protein
MDGLLSSPEGGNSALAIHLRGGGFSKGFLQSACMRLWLSAGIQWHHTSGIGVESVSENKKFRAN